MTYVAEVTIDEFFNFPNIDNIILEYANTGNNPLVKDVAQSFIPRVKQAFYTKAKTQNLKFYLLIDDDKCQGVCVYELYVNGNCPDLIADIASIYVTPSLRNKGWGKKILDTVFNRAKSYGAKGIYLSAPYGSRLDNALKHQSTFRPVYINYFREL